MKIKEVEQRTGVARANIRFYESKGLLRPAREGNQYRAYSEDDVETLRKIVLLRRMGLSIADIQAVFDGTLTLHDAVQHTQCELEQQLGQLRGSLELCAVVQQREETLDTLAVDVYDEWIRQHEQQGKQFRDIVGDVLEDYQKNYLEKRWGYIRIQGSRTKGALLMSSLYLLYWVLLQTWKYGIREGLRFLLIGLGIYALVFVGYVVSGVVGYYHPKAKDPYWITLAAFVLFFIVLGIVAVLM